MIRDKNVTTSSEENSLSTTSEKASPYDWEALGLKIYQENDSMKKYILTGTNLMKSILDNIDKHGDGKMTEECLSRYKGNSLIRELLSKMIVAHRSEWSYSSSALDNVMAEYEKCYDSMIKKLNPDGSREDEIQKEKEAELNRVRAKIDSLSFLSKIKLEGNSQLPDSTSDCGVTGIYISYDAMLERCEVAADAKSCELSISLYAPYTGDYKIYTLCSSVSNGVRRVQERIA